jgi:hypothetical protein
VLEDFTVVPVIFSGDPGAASVPDFLTRYAASVEWFESVAEYGVGQMTVGGTVTLTEEAPPLISDGEIQKWLRAKLDGTHPEFGPTDDATLRRTLFVLVYPKGTTLSDGFGNVVQPAPRLPLVDRAAALRRRRRSRRRE